MVHKFHGRSPGGPGEATDFLVTDERAFCDLDVRLRYSEITVEDGAGLAGALSLVAVDDLGGFDPTYQEVLGVSGITGPALLIGGGMAQFRAGIWARAAGRQARAAVVTDMVTEALKRARANGSRPIGLFVDDEDVEAFTAAAAAVTPAARKQYDWCTLRLNGARTLDEFLESQPRKSRQNWRRDQRDGERLRLVHDVVAFDDEVTRAAAPLISDVSARNGQPEHQLLSRWRMSGYKHRPGQPVYIRTSNEDGVVAYTACRTWGTTLQAHTIGIDPAVSDRRSVYHYAGYLAPLATALAGGWSLVDYGVTHEQPKLSRGCDSAGLWQVDFGSAAPSGG